MKIRWSEDALEDLMDLITYIHQENPKAARNMARRIRLAVSEVSRFPKMGRVVPEFEDEDLRECIVPPYRIVYRVRDELLVARVWHSKRLLREELL